MTSIDDLLADYVRTHDENIRETIVIRSIGLVKHVVGRLPFVDMPGAEYSDLVNYGIIGLIDAVDKFSISKGVKFQNYAAQRIRGSIIDALRRQNWIPRDLPKKMRMLDAATAKLEAHLLRHPTDEELAEEIGLDKKEYAALLQEIGRSSVVSLDNVVRVDKNEDKLTLSEMLKDDDNANPEEIMDETEGKRLLTQAIESLNERERLILTLYYYEELTLKEIGAILGVTESRVCQLHTKALLALRAKLTDDV